MLTYKEFLDKKETLAIPNIDPELLQNRLETINSALDSVTDTQFVNSSIFTNAVRGTLERYGILIPKGYESAMLSSTSETEYELTGTGHYLYVAHNMNDAGYVEGFAQIVSQDELDTLESMNDDEESEDDGEGYHEVADVKQPMPTTSAYLRQARRTDD